MIHIMMNRLKKGVVAIPSDRILRMAEEEMESAGRALDAEIARLFGRSLNLREVDTGSCGACESEIIATTNPLYDVQRFGVDFVASPRHADALLVTGPVSKNMVLALKKTYDAVPEPKFVITLGDCAYGGGIFKGAYYIAGGVQEILPVALHIPGCPPSPLGIIQHLLAFLKGRR
jgi:Ni,Fe-hydrogenase III small subunit